MAETRSCPKCDTMMDYRLGEYDCPSCGHTESAAPEAASSRPATSGPGFIQKPPPPPQAGGSGFGVYRGDELDTGKRGSGNPELAQEKNYILMFLVGQYLLLGLWGASMPNGSSIEGVAFFLVMLFAAALGGILLYFVLNTDQTWIKQCCMGCVGISAILNLISLFGPMAVAQSGMFSPGMQITSSLLGIVYCIWLVSILYRDTR